MINIIKPTSSKENQPEVQKEEIKIPEEKKEEHEDLILKKSGSEELKITPDQPKITEKPKSTEPVEETTSVTTSAKPKAAPTETKPVGEKNQKKKKSNNKRKHNLNIPPKF